MIIKCKGIVNCREVEVDLEEAAQIRSYITGMYCKALGEDPIINKVRICSFLFVELERALKHELSYDCKGELVCLCGCLIKESNDIMGVEFYYAPPAAPTEHEVMQVLSSKPDNVDELFRNGTAWYYAQSYEELYHDPAWQRADGSFDAEKIMDKVSEDFVYIPKSMIIKRYDSVLELHNPAFTTRYLIRWAFCAIPLWQFEKIFEEQRY